LHPSDAVFLEWVIAIAVFAFWVYAKHLGAVFALAAQRITTVRVLV
jgi:hypothetical protein